MCAHQLGYSKPGFEFINAADKKYLELFFRIFFLNDDFSYTLFGDKPMSFSGIPKQSLEPSHLIQCLSDISGSLSMGKAAEIFKKYRKIINPKYIFVFNENSEDVFIYFINKESFLKSIDENIDIFIKELGEDFTPIAFLDEVLKEKRPLLEIIHHHEGILGILLGYGRHNALLFQQKADILGRCWGYGEVIKQGGVTYSTTLDLDSKVKELEYLDNKLGFFSQENEYSELVPVAPLGFGADYGHPETKILKEKYTVLRKQINTAYSKANPFQVIWNMLIDIVD